LKEQWQIFDGCEVNPPEDGKAESGCNTDWALSNLPFHHRCKPNVEPRGELGTDSGRQTTWVLFPDIPLVAT